MDKRCNVYSRRFIDALDDIGKMLPARGNYIRLWRERQRRRRKDEEEERRLRYLRRRAELLRESQRRNHMDKPGKYR